MVHPKPLAFQIDPKALDLLGDEQLEEKSRDAHSSLPNKLPSSKAMHLAGTSKVIPFQSKPRELVGDDMTDAQRKLMLQAEVEELERQVRAFVPSRSA